LEAWPLGQGQVLRLGRELDWKSPEGAAMLSRLMDWLKVDRPVTATPGVLAALSAGRDGAFRIAALWPRNEAQSATLAVRPGILPAGSYSLSNLYEDAPNSAAFAREALEKGIPLSFAPHELKVLALKPLTPAAGRPR
jgi:hypothetical protein